MSSPESSSVAAQLPQTLPPEPTEPPPKRPLFQQPGPRLLIGGAVFAFFSALSTRRAILRRRPILAATHLATRAPNATRSLYGEQSLAASSAQDGAAYTRRKTEAPGYNPASAIVTDTAEYTASNPPVTDPTATLSPTKGGSAAEQQPQAEEQDGSQPPTAILAVEALSLATINVFSWAMLFTGGALWYLDVQSLGDLRRMIRGGLGVDGTGRSEQEAEEEVEEWIVGVLARKEDKERVRAQVVRDEKGRIRGMEDGKRSE